MRIGATRPWSFGQKLSTLIIAAPCLVLAMTLAFGYMAIRREISCEQLKKFQLEVAAKAQALDSYFDKVALLPRCIAARQRALMEEAVPDPDTPNILREALKTAAPRECYGLYVAFDGINPLVEPGGLQGVNRGSPAPTRLEYDHNVDREARSEWYWGTKANWARSRSGANRAEAQPYYTEPYFDEGATNVLVVSVTQAIEDRDGNFIGVAGADLDCVSLNNFIRSILEEEGRASRWGTGGMIAYLLSPKGHVIARTDRPDSGHQRRSAMLGREEGGDLIADRESPEGGAKIDGEGGRRLLSWTTARTSNWKIVLSIPEDLLYAPARSTAFQAASLGACGLVFMVAIVTYLARLVTGPVPRLTAAASAVESGDYRADGLVEIAARRDEFGQLARGFRRMVAEVSAREDQLRQAQEDLARRERHFRSLIENGSDLITVLERDGTIRYESPSIHRVLGYDPQELVGLARFDMVHPDDLPAVTDGMRRLIGGQHGDRPVEYRFRHKSGEWRTLEATGTNLLDDPAVGGIVINSRDVTERKLAQEEIDALRRRHAEELERRVRLRTAELAQKNEELRAAKEATDQAMKQQEIFLSNVAHDLRTPLTIVIGFSEDLLRRARKKGQDAFIPDLNLIVNRGKDLLELINDLLNLSKAMNDKGVELDSERFEVESMIRSRMEGIGSIAQRQGNAIEFRPGPGLGSMVADPAKVWRILMNLLTNSCKFTKGGTITLDAAREPGESGDRIVFRVSDDGIGMGPEQTARLFDRFSQVHASSGRMQAGVGLGLSICQLYCRAMGGTLTVESAVGRGTTFTVAIPAEVGPGRASLAPGSPRPVAALAGSPSAGRTGPDGAAPDDRANLVLIIDDDESICELMRRNLGEEGYRTESAATGEEGLRLAKQLLPSAIILDVVMPGIDGWAVLAALKTDAQMASIPIIMASMLDEKERGLRAGADEYLSKPFSGGRLADLLRKHLGERATARLLVVEDDVDTRDRLARTLREQGWEVAEAGDAEQALARLDESAPDVILLDLMLPGRDGLCVIADVRANPAWQSIPIIVVTAAELDAEDRRRLRGQVEKIFIKDLVGRDDLIREVRSQIERHRREHRAAVVEQAHA